jgi:predicted ATPase/class 3 adenylate cyclase
MAELPSGTVTFLFTDIEGSTARWEHQPEAMRAALARHDALMRAAIIEHGGHVVKTMGDAFLAAFARAPDTIAAALEAQRRLQAEPWGEIGSLRVRMAVHTGAAKERDGDYYGPPLNRAARLLSAGHGGQVLVSEATSVLARGSLPSNVRLVDLGRHRLRDLTEPEHVFQVVLPDLPSDFPPLVSLDARPHNLPAHPTALLGREREVAELRAVLREGARLVTLTGPGGTGKTRLGLQVAAEVLDEFRHGVFLVELAPITDPGLVPSAIAQVLGVRDLGSRPVLDALKDFLKGKALLLVLDNFEQVVAAARVIADLLAASPSLAALVTSREPLRVRGEREYAVPPLEVPDLRQPGPLEALLRNDAVALFIERAVAVRSEFALTTANAGAVAQICARLDGLPLAIELAAARVRLLSPEAMLVRFDRRLPLLTGGARDVPARQRTLRDTIAWSYDHLDDAERRLFRRLAVFAGGLSLEAAETVCADGGASQVAVLEGIDSLVAKSLLRQADGPEGQSRFGMLETIREFAAEQLQSLGELLELRDRHLDYYLAYAEAAEAELRGPRQAAWFDRLECENDNLRAALEWSYAEPDSGAQAIADSGRAASRLEAGIRLADALEFFWVLRGRGLENLPRVMALVGRAPTGTAARAQALLVATYVRGIMLGDHQGALPLAEEAEGIWRTLGNTHGIAMSLVRRGMLAAFGAGDYQLGTALLTEARAQFRQLGEERGPENPVASFLAQAARGAGDDNRAEAFLEESLADSRARRDGHGIAYALRELAVLRQDQGDLDQAIALLRESLTMLEPLKDIRCAHDCLVRLADLLHRHSTPADVTRLFGAAQALRERSGRSLSAGMVLRHDLGLAAVRQRLTPETFATAWDEGRAMSLEQAIAYALGLQPSA